MDRDRVENGMNLVLWMDTAVDDDREEQGVVVESGSEMFVIETERTDGPFFRVNADDSVDLLANKVDVEIESFGELCWVERL